MRKRVLMLACDLKQHRKCGVSVDEIRLPSERLFIKRDGFLRTAELSEGRREIDQSNWGVGGFDQNVLEMRNCLFKAAGLAERTDKVVPCIEIIWFEVDCASKRVNRVKSLAGSRQDHAAIVLDLGGLRSKG